MTPTESTVKPSYPIIPTNLNSGNGPRLGMIDVGNNYVLIDPDSMFWALVPKGADMNSVIEEEVLPMYHEHANAMAEEMKEFRMSERFSAVYFNPTGSCNANCAYCYLPDDLRSKGKNMSLNEISLALDNLHDFFENYPGSVAKDGKRPVIVFHGSEPMLVKEEIKKAVALYEDRFLFGVQTNGYHLDDATMDYFMDHKVSVGISLDAPFKAVHDKIRPLRGGGGTYDRAVHCIDYLDGYRNMSVICTISSMNVKTLPDMVDFLVGKKVPSVLMNPVRGTQEVARAIRPKNDDLIPNFTMAIERAIEHTKAGHRITIADFSNLVLGIVAPMGRRLMCDITPCGGARCFVSVASDGSIFPCSEFLGLDAWKSHSVFEKGGVEKAVRSEKLAMVRGRMAEHIPTCNTCLLRNICGAPCPGEVYSESGSIIGKSPYCEFYEAIIRFAFKQVAEGNLPYLIKEKDFQFKFNTLE
ncbi:MAG: pyrroloquinoline quinone biosynthesis protein PqqE [Methanomassiliicoccales archaeon PtaU1.Bin124]|nr:MAG: pyrroloquinoline quinone biosynthesis protein PqqE [Methanomassiliicoccales archaeon PtaU1.Bin124]